METTLSVQKLENVAFILKTIAHPLRLGIVDLLRHHDRLAVNEICEKLSTEQSLMSHHLANMKLKGILGCSREGKNMFYHLKMKEVVNIITCMENCSDIQ